MKHYNLKTDSLAWAVAFAGAFDQAKNGKYKELNKKDPFTYSIESSNPAIQHLAKFLDEPQEDGIDVKVPETDEELQRLDAISHNLIVRELEDRYGVKSDIKPQTLSYGGLARVILLHDHERLCEEGYWYPKFNKTELSSAPPCDGIAQNESMIPHVTAWLIGYGVANPKVLDASKLDSLTLFKCLDLPGMRLLGCGPEDPSLAFLRSRYNTYDTIYQHPAVIVVQDPEIPIDPRKYINWASVLPVHVNEDLADLTEKGKVWKIRNHYKHDFVKYIKDNVVTNAEPIQGSNS